MSFMSWGAVASSRVAGIGGNDAYTVLLLHMDGTDGSTTFTDSSASAHTVTVLGNTQIDTAQSKFGGASGLFDGSGDYLRMDDGSTDYEFGTGDFTIDFWFRLNSTVKQFFYDGRTSGSQAIPCIYMNSGVLRYYVNGADRITGSTSLSTGTWYHCAVARSGTSTKMFLNGTQEGSTWSDSTNYINGTNRPVIGDSGAAPGSSVNGWLDEYRLSKGVARWTSNFTPPTSAYS